MYSTKMRLLGTCFGVIALCLAFLVAQPAHAAATHPTFTLQPQASGGGCRNSSDKVVGACIGKNSGAPDAYINNGKCAALVSIALIDITNGQHKPITSITYDKPGACYQGHLNGDATSSMIAGHTYVTIVGAVVGSKNYNVTSPQLVWF